MSSLFYMYKMLHRCNYKMVRNIYVIYVLFVIQSEQVISGYIKGRNRDDYHFANHYSKMIFETNFINFELSLYLYLKRHENTRRT